MPDISVNRTTYIKLGNNQPITTGIAEGSMLIDRVLFAQDFLFGQFASSMFEIQIYNIANVAGQKIEVYQLENNVRTDLFVGQIESSKLDNAGYYRDIIAYDKFYFIAKKNVADWFNGLWTNNTQISVLDAYKSLLAYFDIDYDPNTVIAANFSGTLYKDSVVSFEKISFKDMVKYLLEPLALIPYINASGKCAVFSPSMANNVDLTGKYDKNQSVFEEYEVLPMQWVGIQHIDSSVLHQAEITGNTSDIRYDLVYNPIRLDLYVEDAETAQEAVLEDFIDKAPFDAYTPCEVYMIVSDMSIKLGDKITTTRGTSYVSEMILSGPMLIEQQLISRGSQVQQEVEEEYDPVFAYLDNRVTEAAEDLQQQLDDFQPSDEYLEKVGEFSDTIAGGMGLQVITYKAQDGSLLKYFYAPPPAGSAVTGISGSNFIFTMKSTGFAWTNKWEGAPDASSESHVDPGTGDTVSTQWTSGISANGNALLKILNAYKISADIVTTGTLQSESGDVSIDLDNQSINFGNKLTYDPTNGLNIDGSVTIGGSASIGDTIASEVADAVEDLDIVGIDHTDIHYQSSTSNTTVPTGTWSTTVPSVSAGRYLWTRTTIYYTDHTEQNPHTSISYSVARQGSNGTSISISSIKYAVNQNQSTQPSDSSFNTAFPSLNQGDWLWTKTTYSSGSTAITKTYIGNDGEDGDSVIVSNPVYDSVAKTTTFTLTDKNGSKTVVLHDGEDGDEGEHVHFAWANSSDGQTDFSTSNSTNKLYIGVCADSNSSDPQTPSSYSWTLVKGADGSQVTGQSRSYAISTNGQTPPEDGGSVTEKWYIADSSNLPNYAESIISSFETASGWNSNRSHMGTCVSETPWNSTNQYLCSFDRTDYSDGTWDISNLVLVATFGSGSSSTTIATDDLYFAYGREVNASRITTQYSNLLQYFGLTRYATDVEWNNSNDSKILHKFTRTVKEDGSATISNVATYTYGTGSSSQVLEEQTWWYSTPYKMTDTAYWRSNVNSDWFDSVEKNYHAKNYFDAAWGEENQVYTGNVTNTYLFTLKRIVYVNGSSEITSITLEATYGQSYPAMGTSAWQDTIPDISATANKGKYLWTRSVVSYSNGESVTTYTVSYIAADGQPGTPGTNGKGISSITQYFKASSDGTNRPTSGWVTTASSAGFSESNRYLWTYTVTTYSDNSTSGSANNAYVLGVWGTPGSGGSGTQGRGISAIIPQYALSTSNSTAPSSGWSTTIPEYPASGKISCGGTLSSSVVANIGTENISLRSGSTYTLSIEIESSASNNVSLYLVTQGYGSYLKTITISPSSRSATGTYTASSNYENCFLQIGKGQEEITYTASIDCPDIRYYYWQRDKIEWDDGSADTYTTAVLSTGFNAAIYGVNRLNPAFIEANLSGTQQVMIDAGHLYANSVSAYNIAAYEAIIKNLMANYIRVDGNIDVVNGDVSINTSDTSQVSDTRRNEIAELIGYGSWSNVPTNERLLIGYLKNSKFLNRSAYNNVTRCSFLTDRGLFFTRYSGGTLRVSRIDNEYGNSWIASNLTVDGDLTVTGNVSISGTLTVNGRVIS